ncbi:MAG TPA: methyltransferase domain-containing protein [Gammaproteobacteria bacterium]|nr:methyltransferase domain-containing protein [Gammaproteobacteria bacterium]
MTSEQQWNGPDPMAVMRIASAYWESSVLHVAHSLDVFSKLAEKPATAEELAAQCQADARGLEMILIGCVGLGLLEKKDGRYANSPVAETFLVKGGPRYQGGIVSMFADWVEPWSKLGDAVKTGAPVVVKQHDKGDEATRTYIMGMLYRGIPQAELLADEVPLSNKKKMLDVGGGPGIFSIKMAQKNPGLRAEVMDLPQTLRVTRDIIRDFSAEDVVSTKEGNYLEDTFGEGYDVVLLSSMISQEGPGVIKNIIQKSFDAMVPGGVILIQEQFLNTEKSGPLLPALIGLNQLIHTPAGRAYSAREVADWAADIGFTDLSFRPLPDPSPFTLIQGIKA